MQKEDIKEGEVYWIHHMGAPCKVKVNSIVTYPGLVTYAGVGRGSKAVTRYRCTKLRTGRSITVKSAIKFLKPSKSGEAEL